MNSPRLDTILMVESTLKRLDDSVISIAELKRKLPKQVNHNTLKRILEYLENDNKIIVSLKGITWAYNEHPAIKRELRKSYAISGKSPGKR